MSEQEFVEQVLDILRLEKEEFIKLMQEDNWKAIEDELKEYAVYAVN